MTFQRKEKGKRKDKQIDLRKLIVHIFAFFKKEAITDLIGRMWVLLSIFSI